ncbi:MAG: transporter, family [Acidobacteriaceae bacterium]|jgi:Kef-type K+ transport system membrane component KefB|nr:transporter, family [Acidobacteriaceae bacterium]
MSQDEIGSIVILLLILIASAHLFGYLFAKLRQPRVIGEILAGLLLGPTLLGRFAPTISAKIFSGSNISIRHTQDIILGFVYWLGLLLLMFVSGTETRRLFGKDDRRQVAWLAAIGTGLPFIVALLLIPFFSVQHLMGSANQRSALILVIGIAVAVTSIPVISRIFHDLRILHTRFARLVLSVAVLEDIALWAVLAIATALAKSSVLPKAEIFRHIAVTLIYFGVGLTLAPALLKRLHQSRWNILAAASPIGYLVAVLFAFCAVAALLDVNLVFAAFLAGYGVSGERELFAGSLESLSRFSFAIFIPVYFLLVGYRLDLWKNFSITTLIIMLLAACAIKLLSVGLGARMAGFRGLDIVNLAVATNARGGPGIVLASVAYDAGIINASGYTTLVLLAVLTSQAAGAWLDYVLCKGWPLLAGEALPSERSSGVDVHAAI